MNETAEIRPPSSIDSRWLSISLQDNEAALWSVEAVTVYAQRMKGDWMLARSESNEFKTEKQASKTACLPQNLEWKRWALEHPASEIKFWPSLPDKPLVVKTRVPVIIPPNTNVDLYVNLPIWLEISVKQNNEYYTLDTIAPTTLSNTWYGTHFEGQLCYALRSRARRSIEDLTEEPLRIICAMRFKNRSLDSIPVEKIRIQTDNLAMFRAGDRLWTSSIDVTFNGKDEPAELNYQATPPEVLATPQLIREAKTPPSKGSIIDRLFFKTNEQEER